MNRKVIRLVVLLLLAIGTFAEAQQPTKVPRIGYLDNSTASSRAVLLEAFLADLPRGAADEVRASVQSEDCEADRPDDSTERAGAGG
jgi:hypothetical protein